MCNCLCRVGGGVNFVYVMEESIEDGVQYTASILSPIVVGAECMCICSVCMCICGVCEVESVLVRMLWRMVCFVVCDMWFVCGTYAHS